MQLQRKKIDPLAVRFVATILILANGSTTTLEVKTPFANVATMPASPTYRNGYL